MTESGPDRWLWQDTLDRAEARWESYVKSRRLITLAIKSAYTYEEAKRYMRLSHDPATQDEIEAKETLDKLALMKMEWSIARKGI